MVLSNKKLKQKLREDLVKALSVTVAGTKPDSVPHLQSHSSLKELIDSASHKPRLSKREKRRKIDTSVRGDKSSDAINEKEVAADDDNDAISDKTDKKNSKKRKRKSEETVQGEIGEEGEKDGDCKEGEKAHEKKLKKSKKKKKKKRKVNKTPKKAEEDNLEEKVKVEEIQVDTESQEDGIVPKKLYVGGIPYHTTEDEIRSYFRSCGVITKVDCKMRPEDGTFSGIAFITFETEDGANRALAFDRAAMGDLFLTVQQYVKTTPVFSKRTSGGFTPEMVDGYNRVYVGNLAWDTTERDIRKLFSDCVINTVRLGKNKETGEFKGYAHVDFKDSVSVAMALKLDQQLILGRPVKICCALKDKPVNTDPIPVETNAAERTPANVPNEVNDDNLTATISSGKIKRRVCYECGEKGHLSTACPKKLQNTDETKFQMLDQARDTTDQVPETYAFDLVSLTSAVSSGKIKRRVCYECGEKGHLSTACPMKQQNAVQTKLKMPDQARDSTDQVTETYGLDPVSVAVTTGADDGSLTSVVSSGKIKRRTCYECGEKGHLSSACPKKQQNSHFTTA